MSQQTEAALPEPIRNGEGASTMGPSNVPLELENPNLLASPDTDDGAIPNLKFSFSAAHNRLLSGGWSREVTVRELPIAAAMAGWPCGSSRGPTASCTGTRRPRWAYMLAGRPGPHHLHRPRRPQLHRRRPCA